VRKSCGVQTAKQAGHTVDVVVELGGEIGRKVLRHAVEVSERSDSPVTVDYATGDGTAVRGVKYTAVSGTLIFGAGETRRTISAPLINDRLLGGVTRFRVVLSNPTGGAVLGLGRGRRATPPASASERVAGTVGN
jgi:hypothetical protein